MVKLSIIEYPFKNGEIPIYMHLSHQGGRALLATNHSIPLKRLKGNQISNTTILAEITILSLCQCKEGLIKPIVLPSPLIAILLNISI